MEEEKRTARNDDVWVKFEDDEPVELDAGGCANVSQFIQHAKQVLELPLRAGRLALYRHDGQRLVPQDSLSTCSQGNSAETPLLLTDVSKKRNVEEQEENLAHGKRLQRWSHLNAILEQFVDEERKSGGKKQVEEGTVAYSSITMEFCSVASRLSCQ